MNLITNGILQQMAAPQLAMQNAYAQMAGYGMGLQQQGWIGGAAVLTLPPSPPLQDDGIVVGETEAWRCWRVQDGYLTSMAMSDRVWSPYEPMIAESVSDHHGTGVHAFKKHSDALSYGIGHSAAVAIGRVKLWGLIVEHERGFRAEFGKVAYIDDLIGVSWWWRGYMLDALRKRYHPRAAATATDTPKC